jgi:predicted P-loop ATPase
MANEIERAAASLGNSGWRADLQLTPTHQPKALLSNARHALSRAPEWCGVLAYDEFSLTMVMVKPPPWLKAQDNSWTPQAWADNEDALCCDWLQREGIGVPVSVAGTAAFTVAKDAAFHPVRDYLTGLEWDGTTRVDRFLTRYLGAEGTQYHADVGRYWLISAVARIMRPGCKVDTMPILETPDQGEGKSTSVELMFSPWFTDDIAELGSKDSQMQIRGVWCVEVSELSAMTRSEVEKQKAFVSRRVDRFRPSHARHVIAVPRQCIFVGTTNADEYLKDETGGRRYWPVRCGRIDREAIERDRDQVWAEAVTLYHAKERWWFDGGTDGEARSEQDARFAEDPWQAGIERWLEGRDEFTVEEILDKHLGIERPQWTRAEQTRIGRIIHRIGGWKHYRPHKPPRVRRFRRAGPT